MIDCEEKNQTIDYENLIHILNDYFKKVCNLNITLIESINNNDKIIIILSHLTKR